MDCFAPLAMTCTLLHLPKIGHQPSGELPISRSDLVADEEVVVAVGHHAKALSGIDEHDVVRHVRTGLRRRGAADQRGGINRALAAGASLFRVRCAAGRAKTAAEILPGATGGAVLVDDGFGAAGPVRELFTHRTRSRNMLTCDDSTPPSPCSSAIEASCTWRFSALPVICRWVSTRCAIAPPTPQWP